MAWWSTASSTRARRSPTSPSRWGELPLQLDVPVRLVEKVLPDLREVPSLEAMERMPLRAVREADQTHVRLVQELVALAHVARQAGADDVLPRGLATARDGDDVVERELRGRELPSAELAAVLVAKVDVATREFHLLARKAIEGQELDDVWNEDVTAGRDDGVVVRLDRDVHPVLEVVGAILGVDGAHLSLVEQGEGAADGRNLYRLKDAIQNQNVTVEHSRHP